MRTHEIRTIYEFQPNDIIACCVSDIVRAVLYISLPARASYVFRVPETLGAPFFLRSPFTKVPSRRPHTSRSHAITCHGCSRSELSLQGIVQVFPEHPVASLQPMWSHVWRHVQKSLDRVPPKNV